MRYLVSRSMRVLGYCLGNYHDVWDIVPLMVRISLEKPSLDTVTVQGLALLKRVQDLFQMVQKDLERLQKEGIEVNRRGDRVIERKEDVVLEKDPLRNKKILEPLFKVADYVALVVEKLKGKNIDKEDNLINYISGIVKVLESLIEEVEKGEKKISELGVIQGMGQKVRNYPSQVITALRDLREIKKEEEKKWEEYKKKEQQRKKELELELRKAGKDIKVYLDMDGCITDFDNAVKKLGPSAFKGLSEDATEEEIQVMYDFIEEAGASFWADMAWHPKGKKLWRVIKKYNPVLLSSPGKFKWAPAGKQDWVNRELPGITLFLDEDKYSYGGRDTILIDDLIKNIHVWDETGGKSIHYQGDPLMVKEELKKIFKE